MRFMLKPTDPTDLFGTDWSDPPDAPDAVTARAKPGPFSADALLAGSTAATATAVTAPAAPTKGVAAVAAISVASQSVLAGTNQTVAFRSLFTVGSSTANPTYLIVDGLDRNEYTVGYKTGAMGHLADGSATQGFADYSGDAWSVGVVFTYQPSTGQYVNASFGNLSQLVFDTGGNRGDTAVISVFGTNNAGYATQYAANPFTLAFNPAYFTDYGSVAVVTGASAATPPSTATPGGIVSAALGYVGNAWNDNGCWILASDISAKAGATLPLTSTLVGISGTANGEWFVAYNGPSSSNANWVSNLRPGEMVAFVTTSGGGHITTVVSGQGTSANLVDNITYVGSGGVIMDSANDGSASDIIVQAPHAAMQEFSGVNPAYVVVYELDTPVVVCTVANASVAAGSTVSLAADFSATNPEAGQGVSGYQVYETNTADTLTVSGAANRTATSAANACSLTTLSGLGLTAASAAGSDTIEVRASNGSYWGDWTALTVAVTAPPMTAAAAVASGGTAAVSVTDTAVNIGAAADKLQALATSGRLAAVTITGGGLVPLTVAQLFSDTSLLALLPASGVLQVSGATVSQAASVQSNAQVASFGITDTAAHVTGNTALGADGKLASITVTGTSGGDTLTLTGIKAPEAINLSGDTATATGGLGAAKLTLAGAPDTITLGTGAATITAGISGSSGITTVASFQFGLDALQLGLGSASSVQAFDTTYNGAHAVTLTGGNLSQGVVLLNQSVSAASLLATHTHTSNGIATVS